MIDSREAQLQYEIDHDAAASAARLQELRASALDGDANMPSKPIIGCTVILQGRPMLIPMVLNKKGRWVGSL